MTPRRAADFPSRNPVARSLALAVLSLALAVATVMGAAVFAVLLVAGAVGQLASLGHASLRLARLQRHAVLVEPPPPVP